MEYILKPFDSKFSSVLIFGPPGVGKGTLGRLLATSKEQYHLSSGEIFRSLPSGTDAGKLFYEYAIKGELVPCKQTIEIWKNYVNGLMAINAYFPHSQDLLLDGMPRTVEQARLLENYIDVKHIILLESNDRKNLTNRLIQRVRFEGRFAEMRPEFVERRFSVYENEINPLLEYYPSHLISKVNADQKPLEVFRDVLVKLSHLLSHSGKK